MSHERKDSTGRQNAPRRQSRLALAALANTVSIRSQFETVDELDDLDRTPQRKASQISTTATPADGNTKERRASRRVSRLSSAPIGGNTNPAFDTVDELEDLDQKYRKASAVNIPSRRTSRVASPGKEVKAEKEYYFKKRCNVTTKVLVTLSILFFLTTEIILSIYLMEHYKDPPPQVCQSDACINFGRLLKSSIDESVNPCTDFYQYACGNFQRQLPYGERYRDFKDLVNDELAIRMHDILTKLHKSNRTKEDHEKKAAQFHHLCMDLNASSVRESTVQVLQNVSWPLLSSIDSQVPRPPDLLKEAHQHGINALFKISRLPDSGHPRDPFWTIQEGQLPLATSLYDSEGFPDLYRNFIKDLVAGLRKDVENSVFQQMSQVDESDYRKIVDFEAELARVSHEAVFFKLSIKDFSISYPEIGRHYDLAQYLRDLSKDDSQLNLLSSNVTTNVTEDTIIILKNRDYFQRLNIQLAKLSQRDQAVYLGWRILFHYVNLMDEEPQFWNIIQGFWKSIGSWETEFQVHWKKCAKLAIEALPDAGLLLYSKQYFSPTHNEKIDFLLDKLTDSAIEMVDQQNWLSHSDKVAAQQKFTNLIRQLPHSEELYSLELTNLHNLYSKGIIEYDSFFLTLRTFQRVRQHFVISGVYDTPIKFTDLLTFAFGADYRLESTKAGLIGLFPKTLVPPFFDISLPNFAQYSMLGFLYARELAHVIDYEWFMMNLTSEANGGPSNSTFQQYHATLGYVLGLYRNVSILLRLPVDSETLYEDSADQAGLRLAYRAYQDVIRRTNDALLPGFPYSQYDFLQMFFLTFAQQFCINEESVRVKDLSDIGFSHPRIRLTAVVQNSEEFNTAFQCGKTTSGQQLFQIPDPPRKIKYRKNISAKLIDEWYHWFDRKPGLPTWNRA